MSGKKIRRNRRKSTSSQSDVEEVVMRQRALCVAFKPRRKLLMKMVACDWENLTSHNPADVEVCLVGSQKHEGQWVLPAGKIERDETDIDAGERETEEEAGLLGMVVEEPLGVVVEKEKARPSETTCYAFDTMQVLDEDEWDESHRGRMWVSVEDAHDLLEWKPSCAVAMQLFEMIVEERGLVLSAHPQLITTLIADEDNEVFDAIDWVKPVDADDEEEDEEDEEEDEEDDEDDDEETAYLIEALEDEEDDDSQEELDDDERDDDEVEYDDDGEEDFEGDGDEEEVFDDGDVFEVDEDGNLWHVREIDPEEVNLQDLGEGYIIDGDDIYVIEDDDEDEEEDSEDSDDEEIDSSDVESIDE